MVGPRTLIFDVRFRRRGAADPARPAAQGPAEIRSRVAEPRRSRSLAGPARATRHRGPLVALRGID
jgi:hypothetical protein